MEVRSSILKLKKGRDIIKQEKKQIEKEILINSILNELNKFNQHYNITAIEYFLNMAELKDLKKILCKINLVNANSIPVELHFTGQYIEMVPVFCNKMSYGLREFYLITNYIKKISMTTYNLDLGSEINIDKFDKNMYSKTKTLHAAK